MRSQRLLLIPGILCDARLWSEQVESLADCFGIAVAELRRGESISEMAEAVLGQAPRRFSLAGFSLGGQVALEIARVAGERIERLALLSTTCAGVLPDVRAAIENAISTIERGCFEQYLQHAYLGYVHPRRARDGVLRRTFLEMARAVGPQGRYGRCAPPYRFGSRFLTLVASLVPPRSSLGNKTATRVPQLNWSWR